MTEENRERNLQMEWQRALESERAAQVLQRHGLFADSVSRSYYAMLHGARAVLLTLGFEPTTHRGVPHLLNLHFVRTGLFPTSEARNLGQMQADREAADYDRAAVFSETDATEVLATVAAFLTACTEAIHAQGFRVER